ncbi:nuclear pore complex assembly-domain-containing protein [Dipodascopsis uninucleata]
MDIEEQFVEIFPENRFPYSAQFRNHLQEQRSKLEGRLFFDVLSSMIASVHNVQNLYPPRDLKDLHDLYLEIANSQSDILKKHCLLYYILKDYDLRTADDYASDTLIPEGHRMLIDGVYALDRFMFSDAFNYLTHPTCHLQLTEKVLWTLAEYSNNESNYIVRYVQTTQAPLTSDVSIILYLISLARVSLTSALLFLRSTSLSKRSNYYRRFYEYVTNSGNGENAYTLANLPLNKEEEMLLITYLRSLTDQKAKNILITRVAHRKDLQEDLSTVKDIDKSKIHYKTAKTAKLTDIANKLRSNPNQLI